MTATTNERTNSAARPTVTPGIVEGLDLRIGSGLAVTGGRSNLVVHPGAAVTDDGHLLTVDQPIETDIGPLLNTPEGGELSVVLLAPIDRGNGSAAVRLQSPADPLPPGAARIAAVARTGPTELQVAPVHAGLGGRRLVIGGPGVPYLIVDEGETVATGSVRVVRGATPNTEHNGCLVLGRDSEPSLRLDNHGIRSARDGRPTELRLQPDGGDTRFGGPIEGPERDPLTIVGGSDLSLGGGGVLMLGRSSGPNLVLDENEIMARDGGRSAPLVLQWDGGEARFGGPLRGPGDEPLRVVGGSDLSLGGNGVLMIGDAESHHLVLDENEVMAGNGAGSADLHVQREGGGVRFGGPISGPRYQPLRVQPDGGATRFSGPVQLTSSDEAAGPSTNLSTPAWEVGVGPADGGRALEFRADGRLVCWLEPDGSGRPVERCDQSSIADVVELTRALDIVDRLRPVTYRPADNPDREIHGFVAEDVAEVAPGLVAGSDDALGVRPADFAVLAIAALREQQERIDQLERLVTELSELTKLTKLAGPAQQETVQ